MTSELGKLQSKIIKLNDKTILNYCFAGKKPTSEPPQSKMDVEEVKPPPREPRKKSPLYEAPKKVVEDPNVRPPSVEKEFLAKRPKKVAKPKVEKFVTESEFIDKYKNQTTLDHDYFQLIPWIRFSGDKFKDKRQLEKLQKILKMEAADGSEHEFQFPYNEMINPDEGPRLIYMPNNLLLLLMMRACCFITDEQSCVFQMGVD